ncbi:MAG: phenylacetate-CoA oxygenase subunit PaaC [Cyclobacteriaceae bacterium]|nr:phenylacetate-CoA oxygenase subunit PaaC [Cyclobacteriaceae bacterium]
MNIEAIKNLLYKMADDQLILGHRNSEWIGQGPLLEEDIAFASMAQDKVGQSYTLYQMLNELGEDEPDKVAFLRMAEQFHNSQFVELPIGEYDFSLIRHFLFDTADYYRFDMLINSSIEPISLLARKLKGECRYHSMHADGWIKKLGNGTDESINRLQSALSYAIPYALGIFEESKMEDTLIEENIFGGEILLRERWIEHIDKVISQTQLVLPDLALESPHFGGRYGIHTEHLQPLLNEMSEVIATDPTADW